MHKHLRIELDRTGNVIAGDVGLAWRLEELHDPDDTSGGFTSERAAHQSRYPPNDDGESAVADGTKRPAPARLSR